MSTIRYVHVRRLCADESKMLSDTGGTTVAYVYNDKKAQLHYGVARCSEKDKYSRPVGRRVAAGRISHGKTVQYGNVAADPGAAPSYGEIATYFNQLYGEVE